MPSIEQCESSSGSIAALPSTLELFDKFKVLSSISENGKDSDSEESFHLPLDDEDMENQSVVSNGRDREIHNEETEDDILNKFETVPSGTPDQIDSHIEDSILEDDNLTDIKENSLIDDESSDNLKKIKQSTPHIEEHVQATGTDQNESPFPEASKTKIEVKLTYDFGEYENSDDGEFKSIYETEDVASEPTVEEPQVECAKPVETVEPMEIADDSESVECISNEIKEPQTSQKVLEKVEIGLDNFEDSMEVEQEDTNQDIANIIEKLGDQDTPMEDVEPMVLNDESDVNMIETCDDTLLSSANVGINKEIPNDSKNIPAKEVGIALETNEDVEMIGDSRINDEPQESCKENVQQLGTNESSEAAATFQESLEASKNSAEACSGEDQEQNVIDNKKECLHNETHISEEEKKVIDQTESEENNTIIEEQAAIDEDKQSESPTIASNLTETSNPVDSDNFSETKDPKSEKREEASNDTLPAEPLDTVAAPEIIENLETVKLLDDDETGATDDANSEIVNSNSSRNLNDDLHDDELLMELEKTINESSEAAVESDKQTENTGLNKNTEESITENTEEPITENTEESITENTKDSITENTEESITKNSGESKTENTKESKTENTEESETKNTKEFKTQNTQESKTAAESDRTIEGTETKVSRDLEEKEKEPDNIPCADHDVFKAPVEVFKVAEGLSPPKEGKESTHPENEKVNDKTDDDELDLLDISMVRETEEDDACAIADAMNDKDAQGSEKSDEDQSEKVETEQEGEGSDIDKDNDNDPIDFDDTDDDSHTEEVEHDDSSNAESTKDKIVNISESSKDSIGECEPKKHKKAVKLYTDASNDGAAVEVSASESGEEPEKMDVSDCLVPDKSLSLDSTLVRDETAPPVTEKDTIPPAPSESGAIIKEPENSETEKTSEKVEKLPFSEKEPVADSLPETTESNEDDSGRRKLSFNKRTFSASDIEDTEISAKKPKLVPAAAAEIKAQKEPAEKRISNKKSVEKDAAKETAFVNENVKTLTGFSKFMQCRQFTAKLSRSDLEQFCIQKICESLMLKSSEGELHQTIKKHEKTIDFLRKDMQQLTKQCKDLEIVNKKLMNELRNQNAQKKPLVPLKITRSVGLQVRLNPGNETSNQNRRRQATTGTTPQKQAGTNTTPVQNRVKVTTGNVQQSAVVRQVLQNSPQKSPLTTGQTTTNNATPGNPLLSQALQQQKPRQQAIAAKRTATPVRKPPEAPKPSGQPGVIDLTDEDDRLAATKPGSTIKIVNKASPPGTQNKSLISKIVGGKTITTQGKVGVPKTVTVAQNKGTLSQGIRLTPTSVITSNANGSPQMVYVVPTITSNAGGAQKVAFVNFQPTNGVLSGTLNGSTVSVMSNKGQTLTLKTVSSPMRNNKHPASLPPPPRLNPDPKLKPLLPKPHLTIKKIDTGIILQWKMPYNLEQYESIASYQLYAYQETSSPPSTDMWRKVGDVKALALPMACTLTQFADKNKYYFAVRSVDVHKRIGAFSDPEEISL